MTRTLRAAAVLASIVVSTLGAHAQSPTKPARLGIMYGSKPDFTPESNPVERAFVEGLAAHGYVVGRDVVIEFRSAEGKPERYPALAAELVRARVDVILTGDTGMTVAAREATRTIPIVMAGAANPVAAGLIAGYARPGGNVTGVTLETADVTAKRVELLKEALPGLRRLGALHAAVRRTFPVVAQWLRDTEAAARQLGLSLEHVDLGLEPGRWEQILQDVSRHGIGAAVIIEGPTYYVHRASLAEAALKARLPVMFPFPEQAEAGGLMAYGADVAQINRRAADFVGKLLKGARPEDLPVEQPTHFPFVVNLGTARALGLTLPPAVLARADRLLQ